MITIKITPIEWVKNIPLATTLSIQGNDNFKDKCEVQWFLKDKKDNPVYSGWYKIEGEEYQKWDVSNEYPLNAVISFLNLTKIE